MSDIDDQFEWYESKAEKCGVRRCTQDATQRLTLGDDAEVYLCDHCAGQFAVMNP